MTITTDHAISAITVEAATDPARSCYTCCHWRAADARFSASSVHCGVAGVLIPRGTLRAWTCEWWERDMQDRSAR